MGMSKEENDERVAAISDQYSTHTQGRLAANEETRKEAEKAEKDPSHHRGHSGTQRESGGDLFHRPDRLLP